MPTTSFSEELEIQPDPHPEPQRVTRGTVNQQQQGNDYTNNKASNTVEFDLTISKGSRFNKSGTLDLTAYLIIGRNKVRESRQPHLRKFDKGKPQGVLIATTYHPLTRFFWEFMKA